MRLKRYIKLPQVDWRKTSYRFWCRTKRVGACIEWLGGCDKDGYGKVSILHSTFRASRVAYFLYYGRDPGDKLILHRCDNTACVNPKHLELGVQKKNIRDMDARGRRTAAKLTWAQVRFIRRSKRLAKYLAKRFKVSLCAIYAVRSGRSWKHVK